MTMTADVLDVLQGSQGQMGTALGLKGLACIAACSREHRCFVQEYARSCCPGLLHVELKAALNGDTQPEQYMPAVVWLALVARTTPKAAAVVAEKMLSMPSVPLSWAAQLVSAGMRISYAQLLSAVNRGVAGVEVWVQAQEQQGVVTDIPAPAVAICCGRDWVSCETAIPNTLLASLPGMKRVLCTTKLLLRC
jgi:hypothetical protein